MPTICDATLSIYRPFRRMAGRRILSIFSSRTIRLSAPTLSPAYPDALGRRGRVPRLVRLDDRKISVLWRMIQSGNAPFRRPAEPCPLLGELRGLLCLMLEKLS